MSKTQALWLLGIGMAVAAVLVVVHFLMPFQQTWAVNRICHYAWEATTGLAAVGGIVWLMWPRPKARRRDVQREQAHRRVIALGAVVLAAVILIVVAEMHREAASGSRLSGAATQDLQAIGKALEAYAADNGGDRPESLAELTPKYLDAERLYYAYRHGPTTVPPPETTGPDAEEPSYALVTILPAPSMKPRPEARLLAYLRPGNAWALLTVVLEKSGNVRLAGEDEVKAIETEAEKPAT